MRCKGMEMRCAAMMGNGKVPRRTGVGTEKQRVRRNGTDKHGGAMAQTRTDLRRQRAAFHSDGAAQTSYALA